MEDLIGTPSAPIGCALRIEGDAAELSLAGEVDLSNVDTVRSYVDKAMESAPRRLVFELSELQFLDSSGLALLLESARGPTRVEVRAPSPAVRRVIELTGLSGILPVVE